MQTILAVDDSPENLAILNDLLQPGYRVLAATSGERALRIAGVAHRGQYAST
jgi:putative two-component system response regulator